MVACYSVEEVNIKWKALSEGGLELLKVLKAHSEKNMNRHKGLEWPEIESKLEANTEELWSLNEMERTGGEPDVVGYDETTGEYIFYDCSAESPKGRRSIFCDRRYDTVFVYHNGAESYYGVRGFCGSLRA